MGLYKRGDIWWFIKQHNGKKVEESLGTENKRLAEQLYARVLTQIIDGSYFTNDAKTRTLKEMVERYRREYTEHKDYYQKARDKTVIKHFYGFFGEGTTLQEIDMLVGSYEPHRKGQGVRPSTILKELALLRRMFNVARKQWKWKVDNPVSGIELPKVKNERVRYLSPQEYEALFRVLKSCPYPWLEPAVILALDTGLRQSNVCNLTWPEVDFSRNMIIVSAEKMKNADYMGIPLTSRALNVLRKLQDQKVRAISDYVLHDGGEHLYPVKVQRAFREALKAAGIANFRWHDLRHCFCSYLRQRGVDLHMIAALAGHRDLRMTRRYSHLNVDNLREAISRLESTTILRQSDGEHLRKAGVTA